MTSAMKFDLDNSADGMTARLRPADVHAPKLVGQPAGPFEVAAITAKSPSMRDALVTGLLVIYPTVATVVAIVAGLALASANGT